MGKTGSRWAVAGALAATLACGATAAEVAFHRPITLNSRVDAGEVTATLESVLDSPLADVRTALADPRRWCSVLILHIDVKGCSAGPGAGLHLAVVRRYDLPLEQATPYDFDFQLNQDSPEQFSVQLHAEHGPYGTSHYDMRLEAVPAGPARTAVRLSYGYHQSTATGWALGFYLSTFGRGKVGFSQEADGKGGMQLVGGVRGLLERNLMRYFLAVEAAASTPQPSTPAHYDRRLRQWYEAAEHYPRQLHDTTLDTYLALKAPLSPVGVMPRASGPARGG